MTLLLRHLTEHNIEQYLRDQNLEKRTTSKIDAHLSECVECFSIYQWLKSFYRELDSLAANSASSTNARYRHSPGTITLSVLNLKNVSSGERSPRMVLAAKSSDQKTRFQHVITLASEEQKIIARLLYDNQREQYKLFLIGPSQFDQHFSIVELSSHQRELITDKEGKVEFSTARKHDHKEWHHTKGILRTPLIHLVITKEDMNYIEKNGHITLSAGGYAFRFELLHMHRSPLTESTLEITVKEKHANSRNLTKVLLKNQSDQQLLTLKNGTAKITSDMLFSNSELSLIAYE